MTIYILALIAFITLQDNIVLIGHSAGAHLCTLVSLFLIDTREELFIEARKQQDITRAIKGVIGMCCRDCHKVWLKPTMYSLYMLSQFV